MSTKPKKTLTPKEELAAGAKKIRAAKKSPPKKKSADVGTNGSEIIPAIKPCKDDIQEILARRVVMGRDNASLSIKADTTAGEYIAIFDNIIGLGEKVQFLIGDVINEGAELKCFGEKYAAAMASTGRPISTLKHYAAAARNIPANLRSLHPALTYSHCVEVVKVPALEDKKEILQAAAEAAKEGNPMTVKQIRERAAKVIPKKKKSAAQKDKRGPASDAEREIIKEITELAKELSARLGEVTFFTAINSSETAELRKHLDAIGEIKLG